jgi:Phage integrase family
MALRLIRRHLKDCPHTSTKYRRCKCPIHVYGTLGGERIRKALDQTSWDASSELITAWTATGEIGVVKACDEYGGNKERIKAFVLTMRYTGLRIGDAIRLSRSQVADGRVFVRTAKTGQPVTVPIPPEVVKVSARSRTALTGTSGRARTSGPPSPTGPDISPVSSNLPISRTAIPTASATHVLSNCCSRAHRSRTWRAFSGTLLKWSPSTTLLGCASVRSALRSWSVRVGGEHGAEISWPKDPRNISCFLHPAVYAFCNRLGNSQDPVGTVSR